MYWTSWKSISTYKQMSLICKVQEVLLAALEEHAGGL